MELASVYFRKEVTTPLAEYSERHWYAVYTSANHEKCVAEQLRSRNFEHFLPLFSSVRQWKDRRVTLQLPLFPGYVFVRITLRDRLGVAQVPGVARLVGFNGLPTAMPDQEIAALRSILENDVAVAPHPYLTIGSRVRVRTGPLSGTQGVVLRRKNGVRFVISLDLIKKSVAVEIDEAHLEPLVGNTAGSALSLGERH